MAMQGIGETAPNVEQTQHPPKFDCGLAMDAEVMHCKRRRFQRGPAKENSLSITSK
jgi:hypothetical protein